MDEKPGATCRRFNATVEYCMLRLSPKEGISITFLCPHRNDSPAVGVAVPCLLMDLKRSLWCQHSYQPGYFAEMGRKGVGREGAKKGGREGERERERGGGGGGGGGEGG